MKEVWSHKDAETTSSNDGTMKEVWYHKDAKTDDVGTMKEVCYHKDAKTDDVGTMKEQSNKATQMVDEDLTKMIKEINTLYFNYIKKR